MLGRPCARGVYSVDCTQCVLGTFSLGNVPGVLFNRYVFVAGGEDGFVLAHFSVKMCSSFLFLVDRSLFWCTLTQELVTVAEIVRGVRCDYLDESLNTTYDVVVLFFRSVSPTSVFQQIFSTRVTLV